MNEADIQPIKRILEGALLAAAEPLSLNQLNTLFPEDEQPGHGTLREALAALDADCEERAVELTEVASGYRLQVRQDVMPWISRLWSDKPQRYSRAMLETLAIIAYRQPITRGEIEQIRGVSVSSSILRTLQEREWVRTIGHRDVPGRPELLGTTKAFLDYFNLKTLDGLPTLAEIKDLDNIEPELELREPPAANDGEVSEPKHDEEDGTIQTDPDEHGEAGADSPEEGREPEDRPDPGTEPDNEEVRTEPGESDRDPAGAEEQSLEAGEPQDQGPEERSSGPGSAGGQGDRPDESEEFSKESDEGQRPPATG